MTEHEHSTGDSTTEPTESGLAPNVAGALSYLLGPITGILFYVIEPEDAFVRFHATQSIVVFGGLFVLSIALSVIFAILAVIPIIGWLFAILLALLAMIASLVALVLWLFLMYKAYSGDEYEVPIAAKYARKHMNVQ